MADHATSERGDDPLTADAPPPGAAGLPDQARLETPPAVCPPTPVSRSDPEPRSLPANRAQDQVGEPHRPGAILDSLPWLAVALGAVAGLLLGLCFLAR